MPKKIRELNALLLKAGFTWKTAQESHTKWIHPLLSHAIIIAGKDGSDAKPYLEAQVNESLAQLEQIRQEEANEPEK